MIGLEGIFFNERIIELFLKLMLGLIALAGIEIFRHGLFQIIKAGVLRAQVTGELIIKDRKHPLFYAFQRRRYVDFFTRKFPVGKIIGQLEGKLPLLPGLHAFNPASKAGQIGGVRRLQEKILLGAAAIGLALAGRL